MYLLFLFIQMFIYHYVDLKTHAIIFINIVGNFLSFLFSFSFFSRHVIVTLLQNTTLQPSSYMPSKHTRLHINTFIRTHVRKIKYHPWTENLHSWEAFGLQHVYTRSSVVYCKTSHKIIIIYLQQHFIQD